MIPTRPRPAPPRRPLVTILIFAVFMVSFGSVATEFAGAFGYATPTAQLTAAAIGATVGALAALAFGTTIVNALRR